MNNMIRTTNNITGGIDKIMDDFIFKSPFGRGFWGLNNIEDYTNYTPINIYETESGIEVEMPVAGFSKEDLKIQVENGKINVNAKREKRSTGKLNRCEYISDEVSRSFVLPKSADLEKIEAVCEHGILTIKIPTNEKHKEVKQIEVK